MHPKEHLNICKTNIDLKEEINSNITGHLTPYLPQWIDHPDRESIWKDGPQMTCQVRWPQQIFAEHSIQKQ